jgi:hypothetical protein
MNSKRTFGLLLCVALLVCAGTKAPAQSEANGPTALVVTYRAKPGLRAKLRSVMASDGIAQFDKWKKDGVFASYQALFTAYASDSVPDMYLIVRFNHFAELGRWQKIEISNPGGLSEKAQELAFVDTSATADVVKANRSAATTKDSQFLVLEYDVAVDTQKYVSYLDGYVVPQFEGWMKAGALSSYATFVNQNPAGAPWASFILLEYRDLDALASRDVIKTTVRAELSASNPAWKKWSDDKTAIRKEKATIPVLSLN